MSILQRLANFNKGRCEVCTKYHSIRIPIAGSGVNSIYVCIKCIEARKIKILPEYIKRFGIKTEAQ